MALANVDTQIAGSASALVGVLQFTIGAIAVPLTGLLDFDAERARLTGTTTAVPMAAAIAAFGIAALATFIVLSKNRG